MSVVAAYRAMNQDDAFRIHVVPFSRIHLYEVCEGSTVIMEMEKIEDEYYAKEQNLTQGQLDLEEALESLELSDESLETILDNFTL